MKSRTRWLLGLALALVVVTAGVGLYPKTHAEMHLTDCDIPCDPVQAVKDRASGYFICQHTGTCSLGIVGQSCDYQPLSLCAHVP